MNLNQYIDHTVVAPTTTIADIKRVCKQAIQHSFAAVCIPPLFVKKCKELLSGTNIKVATVVGYPYGYSAIEAKLAETLLAIVDGADELDIVINLMAIKNGDWQYVANEINHIMPVIKERNRVIKVLVETGELTEDELLKCCKLYGTAGVDYIVTSTEHTNKGAMLEAVTLMRQNLPAHVSIKASGNINTHEFAKELIDAGASRIGCTHILEDQH
jgi:deoxyribose-phosphate aldolase